MSYAYLFKYIIIGDTGVGKRYKSFRLYLFLFCSLTLIFVS